MEVTAIYLYPIKGLAPIALQEAVLQPKGFAHDRRWMLTDTAGSFLSQRSHPRLALLQQVIEADVLIVHSKDNDKPPLRIPLDATGIAQPVTIWEDTCPALHLGEAYDRWFSDFLGDPCRLVKMEEATPRPVDTDYATPDDTVSFADGFPYLIANQASLDDLNRRLTVPVSMHRFRPNIVLAGAAPWAEDHWASLQISDQSFRSLKPCARCEVTTIDPETATRGAEPLKTLSAFRQKGHKIFFGVNACWEEGSAGAVIRVGQTAAALNSDQK